MRLWVISLTARESLTCLLWSWWKTCNPQVIISNQQTLPGGLSKWINLYLLFSWAAVKLSISEAPVRRDHIMWAHKLELPTGKNIPDKQIPLISQRGFFWSDLVSPSWSHLLPMRVKTVHSDCDSFRPWLGSVLKVIIKKSWEKTCWKMACKEIYCSISHIFKLFLNISRFNMKIMIIIRTFTRSDVKSELK